MSNKHDHSLDNKPHWHPAFWPNWLGWTTLWLLNRLPIKCQYWLGRQLGLLLYRWVPNRRRVVKTNIALCFPELSAAEQKEMAKEVFINNGIGVFETAMAWWTPREKFRDRIIFKGREHIDKALAEGKGILLLGAHFSTLDLGGLLFSEFYHVDAMYRKHNNPLMEKLITKGRLRYFDQAIERSEIRQVIRELRKNHIVWYAPDQDFGRKYSVFAPFFGVEAATITATARLMKMSKASMMMLAQHRLPDGRYELEVFPPIEDFPSGDDEADAARVNADIEKAIRKDPSQYMWVHRRFKTRPNNDDSLYK